MKEDILEQMVDEYLMHQGYFTMHNVKFKPSADHPDFVRNQDSVASDIDIIALHPKLDGNERIIVVSCKSWQEGFDPIACLDCVANNKQYGGREAWRSFRELCKPKWSRAFMDAVEAATGSRQFTYWTAVTGLRRADRRNEWEDNPLFREATELGRMIQLMKASGWSTPA